MINSNLGHISDYWSKIANFPYPCRLPPLIGVTLLNFEEGFMDRETRVLQGPEGEVLVIVSCVVLIQCQGVTDRCTDRQTDGQLCNS